MNNLKNSKYEETKRDRLLYSINNIIHSSPEIQEYIESYGFNHLTTRIYYPVMGSYGYIDIIMKKLHQEYDKYTSFDVCNYFIDLLHQNKIGKVFYEKTLNDRILYTEEELLNKYAIEDYNKFMKEHVEYVSNYRSIQIEKNRNSEIKLKILEV